MALLLVVFNWDFEPKYGLINFETEYDDELELIAFNLADLVNFEEPDFEFELDFEIVAI